VPVYRTVAVEAYNHALAMLAEHGLRVTQDWRRAEEDAAEAALRAAVEEAGAP
jgi:hypothetical protein